MSLSFYYEFTAPASTPASELEAFLLEVQQFAKSLGFDPTTVLNVPFDTPERREFSKRLGGSMYAEDERLKGVAIPKTDQVRDHDPRSGTARLIPERGVVLVVTDEHQCETVFGFLQYPGQVTDIYGAVLAESEVEKAWVFRNFVDTPDPRYRQIVEKFRERGFVQKENDEYAPMQ
jgi:hypothetical protein